MDVVEDEVQAFRVFLERTGAVAFVAVHSTNERSFLRNGHTIVERDEWKDTFYPEGSARTVGNNVHV